MTFKRLATGHQGEQLAVAYLRRQGLKIISQNTRLRCGELDLVARDGDTLVFVEVKTRKSGRFGSPLEAVDGRKQRQVCRAAQEYLLKNGGFEQDIRFDVVGVLLTEPPQIEHIKNAFDAVC